MKITKFLINNRLFLHGVLALVLVLQSCSKEEKANQPASQGAQRMGLSVEALVLQTDKIEDKIFSTGTLLPNEEVEIRPEVSGRVVALNFEEGSRVKKGQVLAKIDASELNAQLKKLKVQEKLLQSEESRQKQLLDIDAVSQEEYDIALNQLNTLEAEVDLIQTQIAKTNILAPFTGVIGLRYISEGGYVSPSSLIASIQQIDPIKVEFSVPEQYVGDISEGSKVNFHVTGLGDTYSAQVYAVDAKIDVNTRTVRVRARSSNPNNVLKPGAFAKVEVVLKTFDNAILVPTEAIVTELEGQKVFISRGGKAKSQRVKTGIRTERVVQITEGLEPKDTVVLTGLMSIQEGMELKFKEFKEPKLEIDIEQPNVAL